MCPKRRNFRYNLDFSLNASEFLHQKFAPRDELKSQESYIDSYIISEETSVIQFRDVAEMMSDIKICSGASHNGSLHLVFGHTLVNINIR